MNWCLTYGVILYITIIIYYYYILYIIHTYILYIIILYIISYTILFSSSVLSSVLPSVPSLFCSSPPPSSSLLNPQSHDLSSFSSSSSFPSLTLPLISFYTCRHLDILIYIQSFIPLFSSSFILSSSIFLISHPHSFYTCRYLLTVIYILPSQSKTDPACFIGVDG